jgi:hypothetical protein
MTIEIESRPVRSIATLYSGTLFRSRLEARWGAMFDLLKWSWAYEPIDLNWHIPDFLLRFPAGDVALEVKPETRLSDLHGHAMRTARAGWGGDVLALGAVIFDHGIIGVTAEPFEGCEHITGAARVFRCINCGAVSFLNDDHHWRCRANGCYAGNAHVGEMDPRELADLWALAGNRVQWRSPEVKPHA